MHTGQIPKTDAAGKLKKMIGDESWREGNKNTFEIRLTYYADADDAKEGRESEYQYKIHFDDVDGYVIKSEGVPEKEIVFPENK